MKAKRCFSVQVIPLFFIAPLRNDEKCKPCDCYLYLKAVAPAALPTIPLILGAEAFLSSPYGQIITHIWIWSYSFSSMASRTMLFEDVSSGTGITIGNGNLKLVEKKQVEDELRWVQPWLELLVAFCFGVLMKMLFNKYLL